MNPERWQKVKKVLAGALERAPEERSVYLDHACTDPDLRREVESLIVAHDQNGESLAGIPADGTTEALKSGTKLGPYTILARIGAGGMGVVYRAHDSKLKRDVAIKILPAAFVRDPERLSRFQREARMLAALNHPNIASIHGLEDAGNVHALVMELAEGPTLAERIRQGPIPVEEALPIARQMADALEYAHEHGIVHRDLKPANVKVAADDTVKVLDFGLAKAMETNLSAEDIANSPTISQMATEAGVLLGTAAYMSPEQAKGKSVDRRADIWAFGCVLYEMLTAQRVFHGETVTDSLAAVLKNDPDWTQLPAETPMRVRVLLQRCLQKDAKQRLQAIGDARIVLDEVISGAQEGTAALAADTSPAKQWRLWLTTGVAGFFVLATVVLWFLYLREKPRPPEVVRYEISAPPNTRFSGPIGIGLSVSPDGRKLAFIGTGTDGQTRLWVRSFDTLESRALEGTEGVVGWPFWSPDSRFIVFSAAGKLKKILASGSPPLALCDEALVLGGAWTRDGKIVFGSSRGGLFQLAAVGGTPTPITKDDPSHGQVSQGDPSLLPDGRHFVYVRSASQPERRGIYIGSLDTMPEGQSSKKLLADQSGPVYVPSADDPSTGHLLFVRGSQTSGTLMAQPFDARRMELNGEAVPIAAQVNAWSFSASSTGVLVYGGGSVPANRPGVGTIEGQLTWFERTGKVLGTVGDPGVYRSLALSPDEKRVAFERLDPQDPDIVNLWLYDFARGTTTRFTFDSSWDANPVWSPDGSHIAFASDRSGQFELYQKTSNLEGEDELLFKSSDQKMPSSWSPDGRGLLYFTGALPAQMWFLPLGSADRKSTLLERSEFSEAVPRFSPDGRWIAYSSDESGKSQVYVRPFEVSSTTGSTSAARTPASGKWMVSKDGGSTPLWRRDGKELFFLSLDGKAMAVDVSTAGLFQAGIPSALFKVPEGVRFWDVSPDGKRFLMPAPSATSPAAPPKVTVVLNWQAGLKK